MQAVPSPFPSRFRRTDSSQNQNQNSNSNSSLNPNTRTASDWLYEYIDRNYQCLVYPLPKRQGQKGPPQHWEELTVRTPNDINKFSNFLDQPNCCVAIVLQPSNLVDVNLNTHESQELAPYFLPPTDMISGHQTSPGSHWWYQPSPSASASPNTPSQSSEIEPRQYATSVSTSTLHVMPTRLAEIRSGHAITIVPPTPYAPNPTERYEWTSFGLPTPISGPELVKATAKLAAAALLIRHWTAETQLPLRSALHEVLTKAPVDWPEAETDHFLNVLTQQTRQSVPTDATNNSSSVLNPAGAGSGAGASAGAGWQVITTILGEQDTARLRSWLAPGTLTHPQHETHPTNDLGNAELTLRHHAVHLRYIEDARTWATYQNGRWTTQEGAGVEAVKDTLLNAAEHFRLDNEKAYEWFTKSQSASHILGAERLIRSDRRVLTTTSELDQSTLTLNLLNCEYDLEQELPRPHSPLSLLTKQAAARYNSTSFPSTLSQIQTACPYWLTLLEQWQPDPAIQAYLQRCIGYSLTGSQAERCFWIVYGPGRSGKSTFTNMLADLLFCSEEYGYAYQASPHTFTAKRFQSDTSSDLVRMRAARFVTIPEFPHRALDIELVKTITGGDPWSGRDLYARTITYKPQAHLWFTTNSKPLLPPDDQAIWDRVRAVPFQERFDNVEHPFVSLDVIKQRLSLEVEGILNWALDGTRSWMSNGLQTPPTIEAAIEQYREELDIVGQWLTEETSVPNQSQNQLDVAIPLPLATVWEYFSSWAKANGYDKQANTPHMSRELAAALRERGYEIPPRKGRPLQVLGLQLHSTGKPY